ERYREEGRAVLQNLVEVETDVPEDAVPAEPPPGLMDRWREALLTLDDRYPRLSHWVGGRLDLEVPALLVSLAAHFTLLLCLGMVGYAVHREVGRQFEASTGLLDTTLPDLERSNFQDLDQPANRPSLTPV